MSLLEEVMKDYSEAKDDAEFDKSHPIFQMAAHIDQLRGEVRKLQKINHNLICDIEDDEDYQFCGCEETETMATFPCRQCGGVVAGAVKLEGA